MSFQPIPANNKCMSFQPISREKKCMKDVFEGFPHQYIQFSEVDDVNEKTPKGKITIIYLFDPIGKGAGGKDGVYNVSRDEICYLLNKSDYETFGEIYENNPGVFLNIGYFIMGSQFYLRELRNNIKIVEEDQRGASFLQAMKDQYQEWRTNYVRTDDPNGELQLGERVVYNCDFDNLVGTLGLLQLRGNQALKYTDILRSRFERYLTRKAEDEAELKKRQEDEELERQKRQEAEAKRVADELKERLDAEDEARRLEALKPKEVKVKKDKPKKAPKNPFPEEIRISEGIWKKNPKWTKWEKENK
jgi:hypothetical protein